jgi:hypothetical protein
VALDGSGNDWRWELEVSAGNDIGGGELREVERAGACEGRGWGLKYAALTHLKQPVGRPGVASVLGRM